MSVPTVPLDLTDVTGTDVTGTDVTGTDVTGTDVTGTDVTGTDVTGPVERTAQPASSSRPDLASLPVARPSIPRQHGDRTVARLADPSAVPRTRREARAAWSERQRDRSGRSRDSWFDLLRAVALVRVVIFHVFGWIWLPAVFPSMGIMFALAGSLMAVSLDRARGNHWLVIARRLRRLLPPLWLMAVILVPVMLWHGWQVTETAGTPLTLRSTVLWILPIGDPPGSAWGQDFVVPLWYLRTYLWFVVLSPAFLWMFRRWTRRTLALPLIMLALVSAGLLTVHGATGVVVTDLATFGGCWLLGFAHRDGRLQRLPWRFVGPVGGGLLAAGLAWAFTHQVPGVGWLLDEIPLAQGLYNLGAVLLLLRVRPDISWLRRRRLLDGLVRLANARAVTIYLWNNVAIFLATPLVDSWSVTAALDGPGAVGKIEQFSVTWLVLAAGVFALGWIEDVAAGRKVRVIPWR